MELYPHQKEAVEKLSSGKLLVGGVGSGKSITSLAWYYEKVCMGKSSEYEWAPMQAPRDLYIITTAQKRDKHEWEGELVPFRIGDQAAVTIDSWNNIKKYVGVRGAVFLFDEDKVIGNGAWVKAFYKIASCNLWIVLTATPGDTWSDYIPVFIANGFYRNRTEFLNRHAVWSRYSKYPRIDAWMEQGRLIRLRDKIQVKMDFNKNTTLTYRDIPVEFDRVVYKSVLSQRWNPFTNKPIKNVSELAYTLRQIVNSDESRATEVLKILYEHPKAIIFYNYDYELEILRALPYFAGTKVAEWNGHKHEALPYGEKWVYLVQYTAGCEGWNCITTDTVIFYSLNYSYKVMVQAAGRTDRMNTPYEKLYYYQLKSVSPIDIGISRALKRKKNFNESRFFEKG